MIKNAYKKCYLRGAAAEAGIPDHDIGPALSNFNTTIAMQSYSNGYALFVSFALACISSLSSVKIWDKKSGCLWIMEIDSVGHVDTQSPQPMHWAILIIARSSSIWIASTWQRSMHVSQPSQVSASTFFYAALPKKDISPRCHLSSEFCLFRTDCFPEIEFWVSSPTF